MSQITIGNIGSFSQSRISKMLNNDEKTATSLKGWEWLCEKISIKTKYITTKKSQLKTLWKELHGDISQKSKFTSGSPNYNNVDRINVFNKMRTLIKDQGTDLEFKVNLIIPIPLIKLLYYVL